MIDKLILMDGYGVFVWLSYFLAFAFCLFLFLKTKKELNKQEKLFLSKIKTLPNAKVVIAKKQKITKEILANQAKFNSH